MVQTPIKRVAVIGAGPAGAISVDALVQEQAFDVVRVFERREGPGGCWIQDKDRPPLVAHLPSLASRTADKPLDIPSQLPCFAPKCSQGRFTESSIYPYLETNVVSEAMGFTHQPIPSEASQRAIELYGPSAPFRHWSTIERYIAGVIERNGDHVSYNTTVERAEKIGSSWKVTLRKHGQRSDYWWTEEFDAVVVASGHYSVPYIPSIEGLEQFEKSRPGSIIHSKHFRGRDQYRGKRVVVVGVSVSAADIAFDLASTATAKLPVHAITIGHTANLYFGDGAFNHPDIRRHPSITHVNGRTVYLQDGSSIADVDHIIFGTGYTWTLPFLPHVPTRNNRVPDLYQHVVWQHDPTLLFVGAVNAGLTFKIFEWQAVYAARLLAGRGTLPPVEEMRRWEHNRIKVRGDGPKFALVFPDFEDYFETVRSLAGEGEQGIGKKLPKFKKEWVRAFMEGHELRKQMWERINAEARRGFAKVDVTAPKAGALVETVDIGTATSRARL